MALDNIELDNLQAGDDVATDLIATDHYQYVKITYGAAGTANEVTSTATNPFPVALSDVDNAVLDSIAAAQLPDGHNVTVDNASGASAVNIQDGGNSITVDQATAANLNVTEASAAAILADTASMDTNLGTVAGAVAAGQMQVDIVADGAGLLTTTAHDAAFGTAGTADAQVRSVQGIAGGTALEVDLGANNDVTVTSGAISATLDAETTKVIGTVNVSAGQTVGLDAGTNAIGKLSANSGVDIGDVDVISSALPTGAATAANQVAKATGGMSYHMLAMAAADNDAIVKASAATVYFISVQSIDATPVYLKLFDAASITPGTTAADLQFMCPSQGDANGAGIVLNFGPHGIQFSTGLCALISTGIATTNNTAVSANEVIVTIGYE